MRFRVCDTWTQTYYKGLEHVHTIHYLTIYMIKHLFHYVLQNLTFSTATRSPKYNFDLLLL
jgi:hypothetical protein